MRKSSNRAPQKYRSMPEQPQAEQPQPLETMFPETYNMIYPEVVRQCNMMENKYGPINASTKSQLESNVEEIYENLKDKVKEKMISAKDYETLQRGGFFRDIIWIIMLQELLGRRRRYPGYLRPYPYRPPYYPYR